MRDRTLRAAVTVASTGRGNPPLAEIELPAGDIVVQRGTDHACAKRSDQIARMLFVLIDGALTDELKAIRPEGAVEGLTHGGPL